MRGVPYNERNIMEVTDMVFRDPSRMVGVEIACDSASFNVHEHKGSLQSVTPVPWLACDLH